MNTFTYTVIATPAATGGTKTKSQSLTGSTNVTFSLSGLNTGYEAQANYRMNKVVVDFDDGKELVLTRSLSGTTLPSLSTETFEHVLQTDFTDQANRHIYFTIYREDQHVDVIDVKFTMFKPPITTYEDVNLLKTDYFNNDIDNEKLLLTFINKNPEVIGLSLLDLDIPSQAGFDPALTTTSQSTSTNAFNVGFTTEYINIHASNSNTSNAIQVKLGDVIDRNTGLPKDNGKVSFKYRTRAAASIESGNSPGVVNLPNNPDLFYIPLTANSSFVHLSGFLSWGCGDIIKDIDLTTKTITIPLIDITGTKTSLTDYYFTNVGVGVGTSMTGLASGGYFYLDLYDVTGCDSITTTTSTITAFVNY
tara:strand:+ start:92 stop:1180 length:1089 start_codon:yes stop_codon:yes gene_type:complete